MLLYRTIVAMLLLWVLPVALLAQQKGWQDVVYLKNGSIIRGQLQDSTTAGAIRLKTVGDNLLVFQPEVVERVAREFNRGAYTYPGSRGYRNITTVGLSLGYKPVVNSFSDPSRSVDFTFQTFNGYQFWPALAVGITTGLDTYGSLTLLPVALGLRGDITKTKTRPYYGLDTGYALDWLINPNLPADQDGGFFWGPILGIKFGSRRQHAYVIDLAYRQQQTTAKTRLGATQITQNNHYQRILVRMGLSF